LSERRALLLLLALAALVRLPGLDLDPWFDEVWMLDEFVRHPLVKSLTVYTTDNHHPLYTVCAWVCVRLFGEHPWALRLPAYAFGVAGVGALFAFARRVASPRATWLACLLLALSVHHVAFSQNARGYTALACLALVSCSAFLDALPPAAGARVARRAVAVQGLALGFATWAHLTAVFVAAGELGAWLVERWRARGRAAVSAAPLAGVALGALVSLALHAPMLGQMARFFLGGGRPRVDAEWRSPLWTLLEAARSVGLGGGLAWVALLALAAVVATGLARLARRSVAAALLCALPPFLCGAAMLALGRNLWPRLFFFAAGFGALVAVEGLLGAAQGALRLLPLARATRERAATALVAAAVLASAALLPRVWRLPKQDFAGARAWVEARLGPGAVGMTAGLATFPYKAWYGGDLLPVATAAELDAALRGGRTGYVITTFPIYLASREPDLAAALAQRGHEVARFPGSVGGGDVVVVRVE
jgi:mannosyltransferase